MAKLFGYGRVSTYKQQISIAAQQQICENYFRMRLAAGDDLEWAGWYPDPEVSAKIHWFERPMGSRLAVEARPGDCIVISHFDRAFRSVVDCSNTLEMLDIKQVGLTILDVDVNTRTPLGRAFLKIMAVIKELEREEIGRRIRDAARHKKSRQLPLNQESPIGWRKVGEKSNSVFRPCRKDREWCREIVNLYDNQGWPFNRILKHFHTLKARTPGPLQRNRKKGGWNYWRISRGYVAYKLGFPKMPTRELPSPTAYAKSLLLPPEELIVWRAERRLPPPTPATSSGSCDTSPAVLRLLPAQSEYSSPQCQEPASS